MAVLTPTAKLAQPFDLVKSQPSLWPDNILDSMIHHKSREPRSKIIVSYPLLGKCSPYGVSKSRRVLSPQLLLKKFDLVRDCLEGPLGLTTAQREVALRLLRLWAYYGQVYPKEATITEEPGCKKATFWRTIKLLKDLGLVHVVNRFVIRPHAQISNLYRLDRLVLVLARYLAEHGVRFTQEFLQPMLRLTGERFWRLFPLTRHRSPPRTSYT